eukprot:jgi/Mesvir1/18050/Mv09367-RA.1
MYMRCHRPLAAALAVISLLSLALPSHADVVYLESLEIFQTHEILADPTVYLFCDGGDRIYFPQVRLANVTYSFAHNETWQPVANLSVNAPCIHCGFLEEDTIKTDDVFGHFQLCRPDFKRGLGGHVEKGWAIQSRVDEFTASFSCMECANATDMADDTEKTEDTSADDEDGGTSKFMIGVFIIAACVGGVFLGIAIMKLVRIIQEKRRMRQMARFELLYVDGSSFDIDGSGVDPYGEI